MTPHGLDTTALYFGSTYLIESVVKLSQLLNIGVSVIIITVVAIPTRPAISITISISIAILMKACMDK